MNLISLNFYSIELISWIYMNKKKLYNNLLYDIKYNKKRMNFIISSDIIINYY